MHRPDLDRGLDALVSSCDNELTLATYQKKAGKGTSQEAGKAPGGKVVPQHPNGPSVPQKRKAVVISLDEEESR